MNLAQNKFLIGFGAAMVVGCGALGFMASKESARLSTNDSEYQKALSDFKRLSALPLYPNEENLKKLDAQNAELQAAVVALGEKLIPLSVPIEEITPEHFQDTLRAKVSGLLKKAAENRVTVDEKFYLGFESYQNQPPSVANAPLLLRQLKAIEIVVSTLIDNRVASVGKVTRTPLPEEGAGKPAVPAAAAKAAAKAAAAAPAAPVANVARFPFEVDFVADQSNFRVVLNKISNNDKQFFIVRSLRLKNTNDKPTSKVIPVAAAQPAQSNANAAATPPPAQNLQYIVGTEKVEVQLQLEMVVFSGTSSK